jgi:CRP-like cAMP-binding protein
LILGKNELLYQHGDIAEEIYFIHSGSVKLWIDNNDFINDEELLKKISEHME